MAKEEKSSSRFWLGAICGTIVGTIAGIIIAPKSGEETRKDIARAGRRAEAETRSRFKKFTDKFKKKQVSEPKRLTAGKILEEPDKD